MNILIPLFIFILGTSFGSFLSVVIYRIRKNQKGIFLGRSNCTHCKKTLAPKDLIPLISYLSLRGKCRYCQQKLSPYYFVLELSMGLIAVLLSSKFPFLTTIGPAQILAINWHNILFFALYFIYGIFLIGIFFYDLQYMEIPNIFLYPFILVSFLGSLMVSQINFLSLLIAFGLALFFFGGQIVISKGKWLGSGDLYLGIAMAFLLGWQNFIVALAVTYIIGAVISMILLLNKKVNATTKVPFAPFMVLGTFSAIFFGEIILNWYGNFLNF